MEDLHENRQRKFERRKSFFACLRGSEKFFVRSNKFSSSITKAFFKSFHSQGFTLELFSFFLAFSS